MEKNAFSPPSETNTTSPNSPPPLAMALRSTHQNFSEKSTETRDFGAEFFSMYRAIFPPKSSPLPSSLSLTPLTSSSSAGGGGGGGDYEDDSTTEHRLVQARLILEHQQLNDHYDLCQTHLHNLNKEIEILRRENAELRSVNSELLKILSSPAAFQAFLLSSGAADTNQSLLDSFRRLDVGSGVLAPDHGHGMEDVSDISPTSVMETNRFERPSVERVTLPKSISVRSTGYQKVVNQSPGNSSREGPSRSSSNRPRPVPNQIVSGTQRVYVPGVGEKEEESGGLELEVYNQGMFKTELCNKWQQTGACPYGEHCQFAHGITELRPVIRHPRYKTEICRMVLSGDRCPYGHRCHFRHSLTEQERLSLPR